MDTSQEVRAVQDFAVPGLLTERSDGGTQILPVAEDHSGDIGAAEVQAQQNKGISVAMSIPAASAFKPVVSDEEQAAVDSQIEMTYYKGPMGSFMYAFKSGKVAHFVNYVYATRNREEIKELDKEAKHIGLLKATGMIDVQELVDPELAYKNRIIREYLGKQAAERARANNPNNTPGDYEPGKLVAANTRNAISADVAMSQAASAAAQASTSDSGAAEFSIPGAGGNVAGSKMAELLSRLNASK